MRKVLAGAVLAVALLPGMAKADSVVTLGGIGWTINAGTDALQLTPVVPGGNQPQNVQCVICGDNQPQQSATFGYTNYHNSGGLTNAAFFSTNVSGGGNPGVDTVGVPYDGSFLRNYLASVGDPSLNFNIGVDINDTSTPQVLQSFFLLNFTTHTVLAFFNTPTAVPSQNNGTGFPDYTLTGFDISVGGAGGDVHAGDQLIFFARLDPQNDGPDSFFLTPTAAPVGAPGPTVGSGLAGVFMVLGLMFLAWRKGGLSFMPS